MNMVDIDLNVSSHLSRDEKLKLEGVLSSYENVFSAHFKRSNMLSVSYNPDEISSGTILQYVGERGINAACSMY